MNNYLQNFFNLSGKVILVTGATGQLGKKICESFLAIGCKVIGLDLKTVENRVEGVEYYDANIAVKTEVETVMGKIFDLYNGVDILINNAGVSTFEPFEEREEEKFDWVMDVNLKGTFWCIQSYTNEFDKIKKDKGAIINVASFYGVISPDFRIYESGDRKNSEIYGATKAGVIQMTKYFAVHLADRSIRVNSISPGGIFNPDFPQADGFVKNYSFRCPMKRMANAEEMIGAFLYLGSSAATYTTGQNIIIDGGTSCW